MLDIFAVIVILVIIALVIWLVVVLGSLPAKIATENNHPQIPAINALAWLGLLSFGILWIAAFVWAKVNYPEKNNSLEQRIAALEAALKAKEA